ncbi:MAG: hypothetical protein ACTHK2_04970 [Dokdonella sp.]|uniref:hypothetical protein n=1 Tax=Dokdonella sp. TaxID=2291710 RepID=UPI003F7FAEE3
MIRALAIAAALAAFPPPDVLIFEHTYDGPRETAGHLAVQWYTGGHLLIEWVDTDADGIFRNSFEVSP